MKAFVGDLSSDRLYEIHPEDVAAYAEAEWYVRQLTRRAVEEGKRPAATCMQSPLNICRFENRDVIAAVAEMQRAFTQLFVGTPRAQLGNGSNFYKFVSSTTPAHTLWVELTLPQRSPISQVYTMWQLDSDVPVAGPLRVPYDLRRSVDRCQLTLRHSCMDQRLSGHLGLQMVRLSHTWSRSVLRTTEALIILGGVYARLV